MTAVTPLPAAPLAATPEPPYWAVIFTSIRPIGTGVAGDGPGDDYDFVSARMVELAAQQPGFLGVESARGADGLGITVSYWASEEAIRNWRAHAEHTIARRRGREGFYAAWFTRVTKVERAYSFEL